MVARGRGIVAGAIGVGCLLAFGLFEAEAYYLIERVRHDAPHDNATPVGRPLQTIVPLG